MTLPWRGPTDARGLPIHSAADHTDGTTGTGAIVLATNGSLTTPTLTRPVIDNFVSANHTHEGNDSTGGLLNIQAASTTTLPTTNLAGDWNADTYSGSDGDTVTAWTDGSGNGRTLANSTGNVIYRTNRLFGPCMAFAGAQSMVLAADLSLTGDFHVFCTGYTTQDTIIWSPSGVNEQTRIYRSSADQMSVYDGAVEVVSSTCPYSQPFFRPCLFEWYRSGSSSYMLINGLYLGSGSHGAVRTMTYRYFGFLQVGGSAFWNGLIKRHCIYTAAQTGATLNKIRYMLMVQAGIA